MEDGRTSWLFAIFNPLFSILVSFMAHSGAK